MAVLDMLELHQFRHSAFCLKVRMVLQAKGLSFRTVEVTPGVGQVGKRRAEVCEAPFISLPCPAP